MQTKPTDLNPVDERLLELQDEVRDHFGWELQADVDSALALVASVDDLEIESCPNLGEQKQSHPCTEGWSFEIPRLLFWARR